MASALTPLASSKPRERSARERRRRTGMSGGVFTLPAVILVLLIFFVPLGMSVYMSFNDWPLLGAPHLNGVANYQQTFSDTQFFKSLWFTLVYTVVVTALGFLISLALALLVHLPRRGAGIFRTAYFVPVVTGLAATSFLWSWMYNGQVGVFSGILRAIGLADGPVQFLDSPTRAFWSVVVMMLWKTVGFTMLVLLIGMQSIPDELFEAARIDGAGSFKILRSITLPLMIRPITLTLVLSVTGSLLAFEQFFITTRGGPANSTLTVVNWLYSQAFVIFKLGYASALAMILLIVIVAINMVQVFFLRKDVS